MRKTLVASCLGMVAFGLATVAPANANDFAPQIDTLFKNQVQSWLADPVVVDAVKAQNVETASFDDAKIEELDKTWRSEAEGGSGPMIDATLSNALSAFLKEKKAGSDGLFSEIFIMDAKGLNVGQSDVTSDYMQGDEAKWQKTYQEGPNAMFIDWVEFEDSTEAFLSQVSATVVDPATGEAIGAITVGVNVEKL